MNTRPNVLVRSSHIKGELHEIQIITNSQQITRVLHAFHQRQPSDYGRLMHYGQCRFSSKAIANLKLYWFCMDSLDFEVIELLINKELEAHK